MTCIFSVCGRHFLQFSWTRSWQHDVWPCSAGGVADEIHSL